MEIEKLNLSHLDALLLLQDEVFAALGDMSLLRRNTPEMLASCLEWPHCSLGVMDGGRLVAVGVLFDPTGMPDEDLATLLSDEVAKRRPHANFKLCMVHPKWRGRGWQQRLGLALEEVARRRGLEVLCATVSPENMASATSLLRLGYRLDCRVAKYGYERDLYFKEL